MEKRYVLSESQLRKLVENSLRMEYLERGGVTNWDWYADSVPESSDIDGEVDQLMCGYMVLDNGGISIVDRDTKGNSHIHIID